MLTKLDKQAVVHQIVSYVSYVEKSLIQPSVSDAEEVLQCTAELLACLPASQAVS